MLNKLFWAKNVGQIRHDGHVALMCLVIDGAQKDVGGGSQGRLKFLLGVQIQTPSRFSLERKGFYILDSFFFDF